MEAAPGGRLSCILSAVRIVRLPPPRSLTLARAVSLPSSVTGVPARREAAAAAVPTGEHAGKGLPRDPLAPPLLTTFRPRHLFNPATGWFRRAERRTNNTLSRHVFPRIAGIRWPYGRILERQLMASHAELALADLPEAFFGIRVLLLTDIHTGPFLSRQTLERTFVRLMDLRPDVILLGGDLATTCVAELERVMVCFRRLVAPLGVYAVLGNHDHYTGDPAAIRRLLAGVGIPLLDNTSTRLSRGGASLFLAGVDDLVEGEPRLDEALAGRPEQGPTLLLSHNPDIFPEAVQRRVSLVLSGHTHGGQIRVPGLPVLVRQSRFRFDEGCFRAGDSQLVVSRGLGATGLPLRIACPPEAVLLTLLPHGQDHVGDAAGSGSLVG